MIVYEKVATERRETVYKPIRALIEITKISGDRVGIITKIIDGEKVISEHGVVLSTGGMFDITGIYQKQTNVTYQV